MYNADTLDLHLDAVTVLNAVVSVVRGMSTHGSMSLCAKLRQVWGFIQVKKVHWCSVNEKVDFN